MSASILNRVFLTLALFLLTVPINIADAQNTQAFSIYLPIVQRAFPSIAGTWNGTATQVGAAFEYSLSLTVTDQQIQGTATVSDGMYYAVMRIAGAQFGNQYVLDEAAILETNGAPLGQRWCIKTLLLSYEDSAGTILYVTWKQDGCNTGNIYLQRPSATVVDTSGEWKGIAIQSTNVFTYSLSLNQNGMNLQGISTVTRGYKFGKLRLKGFVVGDNVILQETEILASNNSSWCLKTVEAKQVIISATLSLLGSWSAVGCIPGEVSLHKQ